MNIIVQTTFQPDKNNITETYGERVFNSPTFTSHINNNDLTLNINNQSINFENKKNYTLDMNFFEKVNLEKIKSIFAYSKYDLVTYLQKNSLEKGKNINKKEAGILVHNLMNVVSKFIENSTDSIKMNYSSKVSKRLYAKDDFSLQSLPTIFRNFILPDFVYDYDIQNCHPQIYLYLCKKLKKSTEYIEQYIENKQEFLKNAGVSKITLLSYLNQENTTVQTSNPFLEDFLTELAFNKKMIIKHENKLLKFVGKDINTEGSILSQIYTHYEVLIMNKFYETYKDIIILPMFDGCIVNQKIPIEDLNELSKEYGLKWTLKPIKSPIKFIPITNDLSIRNYNYMKTNFEKEYHYIQSQCIYLNGDIEYSESHLSSALTNWECWCIKEQKYVPFFKKWLKDINRNDYKNTVFVPFSSKVKGSTFKNDAEKEGKNYNLFKGFRSELIAESFTPSWFTDYLNSVFLIDSEREYVLKYIAHLIQCPEVRPDSCLIFKGLEGSGKDTIINIIKKLIGYDYVHCCQDLDSIFGNFNSNLSNKLVVQLNEIDQRSFISHKEAIKDYVTREKTTINQKNIKSRDEQNYVRLFLFSNNTTPICLDASNRRFILIEQNHALKGNTAYWNSFYDILNDQKNINNLYTYLMNINLTDFDPKQIIQTKESLRVKAIGVQPVLKYLFKICETPKDIEIEHMIEDDIIVINKPVFLSEMSRIYRDCDYNFKKKAVCELMMGNTNNLITVNRKVRDGVQSYEYSIKYHDLYQFMNYILDYNSIKHLFDI